MNTNTFAEAFMPFGYLDIERAKEVCDEAKIDYSEFAEYVWDECGAFGINFKADLVYFVYEMILQDVRTEIDNATGKDILNDYSFYTYGNHMATSYDYKEEDAKEVKKLIETIEEKSEQLKWFEEQI